VRLLVLCSLLAIPLSAQTQAPSVRQQTQGPCSAAVSGSNNQVFTCQGIDKKTADQILRILNQITANQLDPALVITKLDEVQKAVGDIKKATANLQPSAPAIDEKTLVQIGKFAQAGREIQSTFIKTDDVPLMAKQETDWIKQINDFLVKNVRESAAIQFTNARGDAFMGCPVGHRADGCGYWQDIQGKINFLINLR